MKTVCAFANDLNNWSGGYIVIGIHEKPDGTKELTGVPVEKVDAWLKDILNKSKLIQPDYMPISEIAEYQDRLFIVLWCPGGSTRPYSSPKTMGNKSERIHWVRRLSSTIVPSVDEGRELYTLANNVPFDDRPNHVAELADLNPMLIKKYLKEVNSALYDMADRMDFEELCRSLHIVAGPSENMRPVNVGLMFFASEPEKFFPYAQIDIVEFPDGEGGNRLIEHTFRGPLDQQLSDALRYLSNNVVAERIVKQADGSPSERVHNYPQEALKEALANAVYHKGYDSREPIEVRVLPDRIEILSHPGADRSISFESLKSYRMACRRYRNRRVGEFLKEFGLTEGRNTGIHKILKSLRENGSPEPLFETDEDRLYFMITLYERDGFTTKTSDEKSASLAQAEHTPKKRQAALLAYYVDNPEATADQAAAAFGVARITINRDIRALKEQGKLIRSEDPRSWIVSVQ